MSYAFSSTWLILFHWHLGVNTFKKALQCSHDLKLVCLFYGQFHEFSLTLQSLFSNYVAIFFSFVLFVMS